MSTTDHDDDTQESPLAFPLPLRSQVCCLSCGIFPLGQPKGNPLLLHSEVSFKGLRFELHMFGGLQEQTQMSQVGLQKGFTAKQILSSSLFAFVLFAAMVYLHLESKPKLETIYSRSDQQVLLDASPQLRVH